MKTKQETVTRCEDHELEKLIKKVYGITLRILDGEDMAPQGMLNIYEVRPRRTSEYERKEFREWLDGKNKYMLLETILDDLCRKKKLPKGILLMHAEY